MNSRSNQQKALALNSPAGFTLIEVLIATVILSVALLGMATLTGSIMNYNQLASHVTTATTLAQDKIEELKNTNYSSIMSSSDAQSIYTRTWTVADDSPDTNMKTITVTVSWNWNNRTRNVSLNTIVAN